MRLGQYIPCNSGSLSTGRDLSIPFPLWEMSLSACAIYAGRLRSKSGLDSRVVSQFLCDLANPAAWQGNVIWAAELLTTLSHDVRGTVDGGDAPIIAEEG